jgi:hypothetical protein
MEFPPTGWELFGAEEFETAAPRLVGDTVLELLAQTRPNGRCVDHWRIGLGGGKMLTADIQLSRICRSTKLSPYKLRFQAWARDVKIRRNMVSSLWLDGQEMLARREFVVFKGGVDEACPEDEILQELAKEEDTTKKGFSLRFAVVIGADRRPSLELQSLPAAKTVVDAKPAFTG